MVEDPLHERRRGREDIREVNTPAMGELSECGVTLGTSLEGGDDGVAEGSSGRRSPPAAARMDFTSR